MHAERCCTLVHAPQLVASGLLEDLEDLDDAPEDEIEAAEDLILDQATAARSIVELEAEIETLKRLESMAQRIRRGGEDTKWCHLASLLDEIFSATEPDSEAEDDLPRPQSSPSQKLVIFTENRDTLHYLERRITTLLGRTDCLVVIHGGAKRNQRLAAQESFRHDPKVQIHLANDTAGEGYNLQRAHLMVNYDLPWNPNRLEQRFGRIHRIGRKEVCHLWNLVADDTREGDVYLKLLRKLEAGSPASTSRSPAVKPDRSRSSSTAAPTSATIAGGASWCRHVATTGSRRCFPWLATARSMLWSPTN